MREEKNNTCHVQASISTTGQGSTTSSKKLSIDIKRNQSKADDTLIIIVDNIDIQLDNLNANSNCDNKVLSKKDYCVHEENLNKGMIDLKSNTNICTTSKDVAITIDVNRQLQKHWEIRAFFYNYHYCLPNCSFDSTFCCVVLDRGFIEYTFNTADSNYTFISISDQFIIKSFYLCLENTGN
ncbi:unnamed protein product [Mytilus coruscus]|uniref:Uncharacterized protein n=1 Tax=Mytilus coruscus TaxID=42192 RepID=A0A6J8BCH6_MYTCO|nr:unnamed protein product [Mytilus coruscus]